jgi:peptide/nickel transport system substrate-binding protein
VKELLAICMREVPVVPLNQPIHDWALKKGGGGYLFWFHREPDYRQFSKA